MTYINAVKYITAHSDILPSPERMRMLCRYLGDPQRQIKFVHIAGSSGKTSCSYMLSSVLSEAGYNVGSLANEYISEHRELITVNGSPISYDAFARQIEKVADAAEKMEEDIILAASSDLTFDTSDPSQRPKITKNLLDGKILPSPSASEIICAAAFLFFFESECDLAILECGESRADPTGIIDPPLVSVICGQNFTDEQLRTGTGIIRRGTKEVVTSAPAGEAYSAILISCVRTGSRLTVPAHAELNTVFLSLTSRRFEYRGKTYTIPTSCEYQLSNALVVIETVYALRRTGVALHGEDVLKGIARAKVPLKFEVFSVTPTIIFDCPKSSSDLFAFVESFKKAQHIIGKNILLTTPPDQKYDISQELIDSGFTVTEKSSPSKPKEIKAFTKRTLQMSENETLIVLGDLNFVGTIKYQINKALAMN